MRWRPCKQAVLPTTGPRLSFGLGPPSRLIQLVLKAAALGLQLGDPVVQGPIGPLEAPGRLLGPGLAPLQRLGSLGQLEALGLRTDQAAYGVHGGGRAGQGAARPVPAFSLPICRSYSTAWDSRATVAC